jgi:hypothetical protein
VGAGQPTLGAGELESADDLLLGAVPAQFGRLRLRSRRVRELRGARLERGQRVIERLEALALDARAGPGGELPAGYVYERRSMGT